MKIVYISNSIIPSRTANSIHVMKMCQAFADNGHEVILLAPDRHAEYEEGVDDVYAYYGVKKNFSIVKIHYGKIRYLRTIAYGFRASKKSRQLKPNLVYGRDLYGCYISANVYDTIFEAHSPMGNILNIFILNRLNRKKKYKKTVVISEALKNILFTSQKIPEDKLFVAHDGADDIKECATVLHDSVGFKVGYFGHLYRGRGIEILLKVSCILHDVEFHIVGGTGEDISYWKSQITTKNVFFHGFVDPKDVQSYRASCDILVAPYQKEVAVSGGGNTVNYMSPLKIFEYMSSKKAIVASDLPVLREVLHNENSILVKHDLISDWVQAIERLRDERLRTTLANQAHADFISKYQWKQRAERLLQKE